MRRKKTMLLADVLSEYKKEMHIENKLLEVKAVNSWEKIAGKAISKRTRKVYIKNRTLYVELSSAVVRNELMMMKETLLERVNENAGKDIADRVILK